MESSGKDRKKGVRVLKKAQKNHSMLSEDPNGGLGESKPLAVSLYCEVRGLLALRSEGTVGREPMTEKCREPRKPKSCPLPQSHHSTKAHPGHPSQAVLTPSLVPRGARKTGIPASLSFHPSCQPRPPEDPTAQDRPPGDCSQKVARF